MGPRPRGKEEPRGRREREGSRGAGRARGAGRKRGGAAGGGSGKTPRLPARPSQEAGVRTPGPGIAESDLGRPAGHLPARTPGTLSLAPPGLLPLRRRGRSREGTGRLGPPRERRQSSFSGLGFLICQREQRENPKRKPGAVAHACHPRSWEAETGGLS